MTTNFLFRPLLTLLCMPQTNSLWLWPCTSIWPTKRFRLTPCVVILWWGLAICSLEGAAIRRGGVMGSLLLWPCRSSSLYLECSNWALYQGQCCAVLHSQIDVPWPCGLGLCEILMCLLHAWILLPLHFFSVACLQHLLFSWGVF